MPSLHANKTRAMKLRFAILGSALFLISCGGNSQNTPEPAASVKTENATQPAQTAKNVSVDAFERMIEERANAIVLDVRTPDEVAAGRVACGEHIDFYDANFRSRLKTLDHSAPVLVYCAVGGRSGQAMDMLKSEGFAEVYNLDGGINAWRAAGKPTVNCD